MPVGKELSTSDPKATPTIRPPVGCASPSGTELNGFVGSHILKEENVLDVTTVNKLHPAIVVTGAKDDSDEQTEDSVTVRTAVGSGSHQHRVNPHTLTSCTDGGDSGDMVFVV